MFLIFKPPQSILQVRRLDPDGYKRYTDLEEMYVSQILKERQAKKPKKTKKELSLKRQVENRLNAGATQEEVLQTVDTEALRAEVAGIVATYQENLVREAKARIAAEEARLAAAEQARLAAIEAARIEEEKRRLKKARLIKVLLLFATMED